MPDFLPHKSNRHLKEYLDQVSSSALSAAILKANGIVGNSSDYDSPPTIQNKQDWEEFDLARRAIWTESNYFNTLGMPRSDFTKSDNDDLAENAYYAVCEKAIMDYLSTMNWTVVDDKEKDVDDAIDFLKRPNSQEYFDDVIRESLRDLLRYDAAAWVKTFNKDGTIAEFKPYLGTEFWAEIDRQTVTGHTAGIPFTGWYSKGYVVHWWQRSRTGLYISFVPDELAYMRMYRRSDSVYGTDFLTRLKWQIQYLIDSTRAAGKTFANGVIPSIVWKHPQVFDQNQLYQRMMEVKKENQGPYRAGNILHLVRDEEVETLSHTLHDMQWLEGQQLIAKMVWSMFGFQPEEFSGDSANRACYSEDTEVLTENGWKLHNDVETGERIVVYDTEKDECRLEIPFGLHESIASEELIRFKTNAQDVLVTKEHTILHAKQCKKPELGWKISKAGELVGKPICTKCGVGTWIGDEQEVSDDYLRFLGWVISEGGLSSTEKEEGYYHMTLCQSNKSPNKVEEIRRVLNSVGAKFGEYIYERDNTTRWNIYGEKLIKSLFNDVGAYCDEKKIPRRYLNLPKEKLKILFDTLMMGDGSWDKRDNRTCGYYSTTSKQLADNVTELAFKCGYGVKTGIHYLANGNRLTCYRVHIRKRITREIPNPLIESYSGKVYCFSTSTGFYVTRRNGCVAIQGNTAYVSRNVTKSKMLYPLMRFYERTINNDILPYVDGYNKNWKFKFSVELDLDDELKQAQILATKVQTANMLRSIGVKAQDALKLTKVTDIPETIEIEDIPLSMDVTPKQPVKNRAGALEGSQHKPTKEIPFGDKEERQAGINKAEQNRQGYKMRKTNGR